MSSAHLPVSCSVKVIKQPCICQLMWSANNVESCGVLTTEKAEQSPMFSLLCEPQHLSEAAWQPAGTAAHMQHLFLQQNQPFVTKRAPLS